MAKSRGFVRDFDAVERELYSLRSPVIKGSPHPEFFSLLKSRTQSLNRFKNLVVVGTNGKGTTSQLIFHLLRNNGFKVGLFTSPHLVHLRERFRYENRFISNDEIVEIYALVRGDSPHVALSFFEVLTLMAIRWFLRIEEEEGLDFVVWEAGLGGLNDPVGRLPHHVTTLTTIALDHEALIGPTLQDVARHKLGALSQDGVLVSYDPDPRWAGLMEKELKEKGATWVSASHKTMALEKPDASPRFGEPPKPTRFSTPWGEAQINLQGTMAQRNFNLALHTVSYCAPHVTWKLDDLSKVVFWGRSQWLEQLKPKNVLLSGDHNEEGWQHLVDYLKCSFDPDTPFRVYYRLSKDEKEEVFLKTLKSLKNLILVPSQSSEGAELSSEIQRALSQVEEGDIFIITGSLYFVGDVLKCLNLEPAP